jgi:hypothetical protein
MLVAVVNNVVRFVNDPRTFADIHGHVNFAVQVQAMCSLSLLFSDLQHMNASSRAYNRTKVSFSIIDKLANLRKELGGDTNTESAVAMRLASLSQSKWVRKILGQTITPSWPKIGDQLRIASRCFLHTHRHLHKEMGITASAESERLHRLQAYRNLSHGTFLRRQQFEKVFLTGTSAVPASLPTMSVILMIAFLCDPRGFLAFRPYVAPDRV